MISMFNSLLMQNTLNIFLHDSESQAWFLYLSADVLHFSFLQAQFLSSPSQDVEDNSAAHHERHHGVFGFDVDSPQQQHHGNQTGHGNLSKESACYCTVCLQHSERSPVGFDEFRPGGHRLLASIQS